MKKFILFAVIALTAVAAFALESVAVGASLAIIPTAGGLSVRQLESFASGELSSFDGEDDGYDDYEEYESFEEDFEGDYYTGENDDFVDFGGYNKSFANAGDSGRIFVMTIANTATDARNVYLMPGYTYYPGKTGNGIVVDGAFNDAAGGTGCTGSGSPKTILDFYAFLQHCPTHIGGIKIEGSVAAQVSQQLKIEHLSPFKTLEEKIINLGSYQNENTYRDKIVTIPTPDLVLSNQVKITLTIPASCTTTITFLAGGILNPSHAMQQKVSRAKSTIAKVGLAPLKRKAVIKSRPGLPGRR